MKWTFIVLIVMFPYNIYAQNIRHNDLADMPQQGATNRDHDSRYHRKNDNIYAGKHFLEMYEDEPSTVGTPESDKIRVYATDNGGTTSLAIIDSNGNETILGLGGGGGGGGVTDHGALTGLADDDHAQYMTSLETDASITTHTADANAHHTPTVDTNTAFSLDDSTDIGNTTDNDITVNDITISTPSNIYALSHDSFADFLATEHFTEAAIDHGNIAGLEDDDHSLYMTNLETDASITAHTLLDLSSAHSSTLGAITDVTANEITKDEVLKWNGSAWVPAAYDYSFVFDYLTFDDGETTGQLIGSGEWKASGAITFTMTYDNGPPSSAYINVTGAGSGNGWNMLPITTGDKTSEATTASTHYPDATNGTISFTSIADALSPNSGSPQTVQFFNNFRYDDYAINNGFVDADIDALATAIITNDTTRTFTQSIGATNYMVFAHRTGDTTVKQVRCGTGSNQITAAFDRTDATAVTPLKETVSHSNDAGNPKTEDFYVYASKEQNLDSHSNSFTTLSSGAVSNYIRIGEDNLSTGWSNADFLALVYKYASTSDEHRIGMTSFSFTPTGNYLVYTYPDGWGNLTAVDDYEDDGNGSFLFDGVSAAMTYDGLNTIVNEAGFSDSYRTYVSTGTDYGSGSGIMTGLSGVNTYNFFYYGITSGTSGFAEADCEDSGNMTSGIVTNTLSTLLGDYAVTPGAGEYILLCIPVRMGDEEGQGGGDEYKFLDGAFPFDFNDPETINNIQNYNNFTENYYAYRSYAANLGSITVTIAAP